VITSKTHWKCDLCANEAVSECGGSPKEPGWVHLSIEDRYVDRMFYEKAVCPTCSKEIAAKREEAGS